MLELAMAALNAMDCPSIDGKQLQRVAHLRHDLMVVATHCRGLIAQFTGVPAAGRRICCP